MAKPKFGKDDYADLVDMFENDELPDAARLGKLLGRSQVYGEFDEGR